MKDGGKIERRKELHENQQERMPRREERRKQEGKSPSEFGRRRGIKIDGRKKEEGRTGRDRPKKKNDHGWLAPGVLKQLTRSLPPPVSLSRQRRRAGGGLRYGCYCLRIHVAGLQISSCKTKKIFESMSKLAARKHAVVDLLNRMNAKKSFKSYVHGITAVWIL